MARKKRLKIALIGYGAISQTLFDIFREKKPDIDIIGVLVRPAAPRRRKRGVGRKVPVVETLKALLKLKPDVVVEAASQQAVRDWGETILNKGIDLMVIYRRLWRSQALREAHQGRREERGAAACRRAPSPASTGFWPCGWASSSA